MSKFKQLEETFDLPELTPQEDDSDNNVLQTAKDFAEEYRSADPFEMHDEEMDEIGNLALGYGKDLHDLGMSVDSKLAGEIFNAAASMLKIAADTRNSKLEKRLKLMKMEFDRLKLDRTNPDTTEVVETTNVKVLDRNELLAQLKKIQES
jgi:hypothetical protein